MRWRLVCLVCVCVVVAAVPACAFRPLPGAVATAKEPLHAESGVGVTVWKIPIAGIGAWGTQATGPPVVVHQYNYQAVPKPTAGGIPTEPPGPPQPVPYETIFPPRPSDDPTAVIFQNWSERAVLYISINDKPPITLPPLSVSPNISLGAGEHKVKWWGEVPTAHPAHPVLKSRERSMFIRIRAEDSTRIIPLSER